MSNKKSPIKTGQEVSKKKFKLDVGKVLWIMLIFTVVITAYYLLRPSPNDDPATAEPIVVTSDELIDIFADDPRAAQDQYMGEYIEMTATLYGLDAKGNFISIGPLDEEYSFNSDLYGKITDEHYAYLADIYEEGIEVEIKGVIVAYNALLGCQIEVDEIAVKYY